MSIDIENTGRRQFLKVAGTGALAATLGANISKALAIPANNLTGTINDVEHIVILTQENSSFDHHFGTLRGVRGFADPRAARINLPTVDGGTAPASVFLQPCTGSAEAAPYGVSPASYGGPANGVPVLPPIRLNPEAISPGLTSLGLTWLDGTGHGWPDGHAAWNLGANDGWVAAKQHPWTMAYMTRADIPYHYALADAFTVGDNYHCSIMAATNPNRCYLWSGCVGTVDYLGAAGTDGLGAGPIINNGLSPNHAYLAWETFPEVLQAAGVTWKIYQDINGQTFAPDFGDAGSTSFIGNYTDNSVLYFAQYANAAKDSPLYLNGCTGTRLDQNPPAFTASADAWQAWNETLFDQFRADVTNGTLPQVSWICAPAGYTEHSSYPINYGAWYMSKIFDILVSNPEVWSKTVFIINYDENDGGFDHLIPPSPPGNSSNGDSTVDFHNEIITTAPPHAPAGLGARVPLLVISPWSKGGYVNSQVFDHTSTIQFIEKRFGVFERNISPWRRAVCGDLTSAFNFANPNEGREHLDLPSTAGYLPTLAELQGNDSASFPYSPSNVIVGVPKQEEGIRRARALPYEINVQAAVNLAAGTVGLQFSNTGKQGVALNVRSTDVTDQSRNYTVEAGKNLSGSWNVGAAYDLTVLGPNGFFRQYAGSTDSVAAVLDVRTKYGREDKGSIAVHVRNLGVNAVILHVLDAYTGNRTTQVLGAGEEWEDDRSLEPFHGWYDLVFTVAEDPTLRVRLAGHVETGKDSISDPAMGGLVKLKA